MVENVLFVVEHVREIVILLLPSMCFLAFVPWRTHMNGR